jgi:hypothetical protein
MRTALPIAGLTLVAGLVASTTHGCSTEPPFESLCLWVADPNNCYRKFRAASVANGDTCKPSGDPSPVDLADPLNPNGTSNGSFLSREKLDVCLIAGGGQVVFDPPIDLASYPPSPLAEPITYKIAFKRSNGSDCGSATYSSPHGFSFTINAPPDSGSVTSGNASTGGTVSDAGPPTQYGSYTQVIQPGRDAFDATCPTGESHHLNLAEVEGTAVADDGGTRTTCPRVAQLVPRAALVINPGGIGLAGAVSFTVYWPSLDIAYPTDPLQQSGAALAPEAITYFTCTIAAAPRPCEDGARDLDETDVDCGGPELAPGCPARCPGGATCVAGVDCKSGTCTNLVCQ